MRITLALAFFLLPAFAHSASFDCQKASTPVERMVCADADLSGLDDVMAGIYTTDSAREHGPALRTSQRAWLKLRDACPDTGCVKQRYQQRIAELACDPKSQMAGSGLGTNQCSHFSKLVLEPELAALEERQRSKAAAESNNPQYLVRTLVAEQKAWREYRSARCAYYGAGEGGSDAWKNAFAAACELDDTKKRIAAVKKELAER